MAEPTYFGVHLAGAARHQPTGRDPVAIVGGGLVGMALALALKRHGVAASIFDARPRGAARHDPRVLALSHGSQQSFEWLGVWPSIAAAATPIATIHVSQRGGFGRTRLTAQEQGVPALGQVVAAGRIAAALDDAIAAAGIDYRDNAQVVEIKVAANDADVMLRLADGAQYRARLVVHAEGGIAGADEAATTVHDYRQQALICDATVTAPHQRIAYERFTPQGPLALLPHGGDRQFSVVYTCAPDEAARLMALTDADFLAALQAHFGGRLTFAAVGPRHAFPLGLRLRRSPVGPRCVWLGNAAQTLHPVAGQGFNLALRDIRDLARVLAESADAADPGAAELLARYATARRLDRHAVAGVTDGLVRLFSNDDPLLKTGRGLGLLALDLLPPLRGFVARRMMYGVRGG